MGGISLFILDEADNEADADRYRDVVNISDCKNTLVYHLRANGVMLPDTVPLSSLSCVGTLGQLFTLLYRSFANGGKSLVYSQEDVLTISKMAQMKSGDDEVGNRRWFGNEWFYH